MTCLASLVLLPGKARSQFSPGPLSQSHHSLEGASNCFKCHATGAGVSDAKCVACHTEIGWMRGRGRGLHARVKATPCAKCHPDHAGADFQLVHWDEGAPEKFDHHRAGFALEGKHASLECRQCHQPKMQKSGAAPMIRQKDHARSWLGLETACASCHADPHTGELGADCQRCHGQKTWKPAAGFDHSKSRYPLVAKHSPVACASCHPSMKKSGAGAAPAAAPAALLHFKGILFADCAPCHKDPHAGRFQGACSSCHSTSGFQVVDKRRFDHDRTRFALKGRHADVDCAKCHDPRTAGGKKPPFAHCTSCHQDAHKGQATLAGRAADCLSCHDERGWKPSTFTAAAHAATRYPLEGAHGKADCSKCHTRSSAANAVATLGASRVLMHPPGGQCADCHADPHQGRFASKGARPQKDGCRTCHSLQAFIPSSLDMQSHTRAGYGFALEGAHRAIPCMACHSELKAPRAASSLRGAAVRALFVAEAPATCADCHKSPHGDQFARRKKTADGLPGDACEACHGVDSFEPAGRFQHDRDTEFHLGGAHSKVACEGCHRPARDSDKQARVIYHLAPKRCEECHDVRLGPDGKPVVVPATRGKP